MAGKFICDLTHPDAGLISVYETQNGARVYGHSDKLGTIPFQDKKRQNQLRGLLIAEGYGDELKRKPTPLEVANFAPEKTEVVTVSVMDNVPEVSPQPKPETIQPKPENKTVEDGGIW